MAFPLDAEHFYDQLSAHYHLVYGDWGLAIDGQGKAIARLLALPEDTETVRILDCACGIGTQTIGLAKLGFDVTGMDISRKAVRRARWELKRRRLRNARVMLADMRSIPPSFGGQFEAVVCMDNPLAHLLSDAELVAAFRCMYAVLRSGGKVLVGARDYESARKERPSQRPIRRNIVGHRDTIVFQLWNWDPDGKPFYTNEHFTMRRGPVGWKVNHLITKMRAHTQAEIAAAAQSAGFREAQWLQPEANGYFQPTMRAARP